MAVSLTEAKIGYANLTSSHGDTEPERIQLQLTHEVLVLLREEYVPEQPEEEDCERKEMLEKVLEEYVSEQPEEEDCERKEMLEKVRTVEIYRDAGGGLGLSVKGGAEHKIPALISRIVPGQAAAHTEQLFVGDAILKVNDQNVECYTHDQLIEALKNAGDVVTLVVKYFKPAAIFLNKSLQSASENDNENVSSSQCGVMPHLKKQWVVFSSIPLIYAYLTRYFNGTDKLRTNAFEVMGIDGNSSGILQFEDSLSLAEWIAAITNNITQLLNQMVRMMNRLLLPEEQIMYMGWGQERASPGRNWQAWKPKFIALKGTDIYLFDIPPMQERDWLSCNTVFHVYECMFKVLKDSELVDDKQHCCSIQTGSKETIYVSVESRSDLLQLERSWYRTNHQAVIRLKSRTFGCTYKGRLSGLSLDIDVGFSLYDSETKSYLWCYKFSRLKGSSDDGKLKLKLHFHAETQGQVETREIECSSLQTLLYCIHAFLSAKLASVDPEFLKNY